MPPRLRVIGNRGSATEPVTVCHVGVHRDGGRDRYPPGGPRLCARGSAEVLPPPTGSGDPLMGFFKQIMPSTKTGTRQRVTTGLQVQFASARGIVVSAFERLVVPLSKTALVTGGVGRTFQSSRSGRKRAQLLAFPTSLPEQPDRHGPGSCHDGAEDGADSNARRRRPCPTVPAPPPTGRESPVFRPAAADCYLYLIVFSLDSEADA